MNKVRLFTLLFLIAVSSLLFVSINSVSASNIYYDGLLGELTSSDNFDFNDYPAVDDDYSLDVITITESSKNKLVVYVYQPAALSYDIKATRISMSTEKNNVNKVKFYDLTLLETSDVFAKYVVDNFEVSNEEERYYAINGIYRLYDPDIDYGYSIEQGDGFDTKEKKFKVGKQWRLYCDDENKLKQECVNLEVMEVEIEHTGHIKYDDGFHLFGEQACLSHYIAFSCDEYIIQKLYDADVTYSRIDIIRRYATFGGEIEHGSNEQIGILRTLYEEENVTYKGDGLFAKTYEWKRIETAQDFIKNETLDEETKSKLENAQWVLRFLETDYYHGVAISLGKFEEERYTRVYDVSILRLHFRSQGKEYNLGVVSDIVTPDLSPDGGSYNEQFFDRFDFSSLFDLIKIILGIIVVVGLIALFAYFPGVFKVLINILIFPFNLIGSLFKKKDEKTDKKKE